MRYTGDAAVLRVRAGALIMLVGGLGCAAKSDSASLRPAGLASSSALTTRTLVFRGVTVIDVRDGKLHRDQSVVIVGTRIRTVGAVRRVRIPAGARVVEAAGLYLIPGLWDMHIHITGGVHCGDEYCHDPHIAYPLLIANGVTGIRDPGEGDISLATELQWRREVAAGTRIGPRSALAGPFVQDVPTPERGRFLVDSLRAAGADFIKVHDNDMPRPIYFAIAAEARRIGIPFDGHVPDRLGIPGRPPGVSTTEASDSGQRILDHPPSDLIGTCMTSDTTAGATTNVARCTPITQRLRRNGSWVVPTLMGALSSRQTRSAWRRTHLRFVPRSAHAELHPPEAPADSAPDLGFPGRFLAVAQRAGLPLLAGTDGGPRGLYWLMPGFGLQNQLALFVDEGLTPLAALQTATLNPALALRAADSLGTVAPGKLADLVLLEKNPLVDIDNLAAIRAVVANGRYFDRAALDRLLDDEARTVAAE